MWAAVGASVSGAYHKGLNLHGSCGLLFASCDFLYLTDILKASIFKRGLHAGHVLDHNFVIASLAFLASRLLGATRRCRAAITIQQAYRHVLRRRHLHRRYVSLKLACDCQTVVLTRERVVHAAKILQRGWRSHLGRKLDALVTATVKLQAHARGAMVRKMIMVEGEIEEDLWLPSARVGGLSI